MKKRFAFAFKILASLVLSACVIPSVEGAISALVVKPKQSFYVLDSVFIPADELVITAVDNTGHRRTVPANATRIQFDDTFHVTGEKRGTVTYMGKVEEFTVIVYDPTQGPPLPEGPVIIIDD